MDIRILSVLKAALLVWINILGLFNLSSDLLHSTYSFSMAGILLLLSLIYFFRIPPPSQAAVEAVIGADPIYDTPDNDSFFMKVVAHRGAGLDAPENSLIAFKMCAEKGCAGIEFDVTLTADDVPIIFHDDTLERLTGAQSSVRNMTWKELSSTDISVKHPLKEKFENTRIAKLDDTILQCINNKQKMFIDIKENDIKIVKIILDLYQTYPDLESKAVCTSFFPQIIYMIRRRNPKIVCSLAWRPHLFAYESYTAITGVGLPRHQNYFRHTIAKLCDTVYTWTLPRIIHYMAGLSIILIHKDGISGKIINDWRQKGVRVIAWTVNHPVEKQHFSRIFKITYMTDTLIGESSAHANNNARIA